VGPRMRIQKHSEIDKVLVVGAAGNVGRHLIPELLSLRYKVRALQFQTEIAPQDGLEVAKGNTLDADSIRRAMEGVDAVCHLIRAGSTPGDTPCERWFNCCVLGARNMLEAAKDVSLVRFIAGSADNVFGHATMPHYGPINENHPKRFADGYYGLFKIIEEEMCRQYHLGFDVPIVITRFGWIWTSEFLHSGAGCLDRENKRILMRLDVDGRPHVRHDVHIEDAVQGVLLALQKDVAVGGDFTFVSPAPYSSEEISTILSEKFDWPVGQLPSDLHSWTIDDSKARSMLGYNPRVNVLEWLRKGLNAGA
jgi:nucleoside-diphosphate-sugar epimerase